MSARRKEKPAEDPKGLETRLGHAFADPELLLRALTHSSYAHEVAGGGKDNEPLEFLGDALLGALVSERLFRSFPQWDEGDLSRFKAALVNAETLAAKARKLRLGDYVRLGSTAEKAGSRTKGSLLSDTFEAVLAALYLDAGIDAARAFLERMFAADFRSFVRDGAAHHRDAKTDLQEFLQARRLPTPRYQILKESGPAHRRNFLVGLMLGGTLVGQARGRTRKVAEQAAARKVLGALREQDPPK